MNRSSSGRPHEVAPKQSSMYRPKSSGTGPSNWSKIVLVRVPTRLKHRASRIQPTKVRKFEDSDQFPKFSERILTNQTALAYSNIPLKGPK